MGLNVWQEPGGTTFAGGDDRGMEFRFDGDGLIDGVHLPARRGKSGKVRRQTVQIEERRNVGVPPFPEGVPEKAQHPLSVESTALGVSERWR